MAKTVVRSIAVPAGGVIRNVLANTNFQFADNPGPEGLVQVQLSVVSDVADNEFEAFADKDFVADETAAAFAGPPRIDQDPFQLFVVTPGTQLIVNLKNNSGAPADFHTLVSYEPV